MLSFLTQLILNLKSPHPQHHLQLIFLTQLILDSSSVPHPQNENHLNDGPENWNWWTQFFLFMEILNSFDDFSVVLVIWGILRIESDHVGYQKMTNAIIWSSGHLTKGWCTLIIWSSNQLVIHKCMHHLTIRSFYAHIMHLHARIIWLSDHLMNWWRTTTYA